MQNSYKLGLKEHIARRILTWFAPWIKSDVFFLKCMYRINVGKKLDLSNPLLFGEKIQWLKLYDRKPEYVNMVDKIEAKEYVASIIGSEYIIPTLETFNRVEEVDFDKLPNQFVLKCTHDSGDIVICKDKALLDRKKAIKKLKKGLKRNFYWKTREWPYKNVKPRIIAEKYMEADGMKGFPENDLIDYKFFCFEGEPKFCQVIRDRRTNETIDFYDMDWKHQEFVGLSTSVENGKTPVEKPEDLMDMINICRLLAKGINFVRIDLYSINNKTYFGEITFYPNSGFGFFCPDEWNLKLGEMIKLPFYKY